MVFSDEVTKLILSAYSYLPLYARLNEGMLYTLGYLSAYLLAVG